MPELPEVETVRCQLHDRLAGRVIRGVQILRTGREFPAGEEFVARVAGRRIAAVERRAKVLVWRLDSGDVLLGHLKMTGKFLFVASEYLPTKHDCLIFDIDGQSVVWSDVRRFGYLRVHDTDETAHILSLYGPEPLETSAKDLAERLLTPQTRKIKAALLDQTTIAGIGNIYADEACHRAGIRPMRRLSTLTAADRLRLAEEIRIVLAESLAQKGTSSNDYVDTDGERGGFLSLLRVYGRTNEPCRTCQTSITKIVLGGRGTHYCSKCQK